VRTGWKHRGLGRVNMATSSLSQAIRNLAETEHDDPVILAGVSASVRTLNEGVYQWTRECDNPELARKHRARLIAALLGIADALEQEEATEPTEFHGIPA